MNNKRKAMTQLLKLMPRIQYSPSSCQTGKGSTLYAERSDMERYMAADSDMVVDLVDLADYNPL